MSAYLDQKVWMLSEEQKDLKERIDELEKKIEENQQKDVHDIKEILVWMKEEAEKIKQFNEQLLDLSNTIGVLQTRKDWIDKIIEKIKKFLPI